VNSHQASRRWSARSPARCGGRLFEQRRRWMYNRLVDEPRLTADYAVLASTPEPLLPVLARRLSDHYGVPYDGVWFNLYRNHHDSTGWHGDWPTCKREECIVPVLTLGATRRFLPCTGGSSIVLTPTDGDLVVMGGRCETDWRHCVPKQARPAGMRISINFSDGEYEEYRHNVHGWLPRLHPWTPGIAHQPQP
jgi:alkylated DNA repair dioxygenase AlkB